MLASSRVHGEDGGSAGGHPVDDAPRIQDCALGKKGSPVGQPIPERFVGEPVDAARRAQFRDVSWSAPSRCTTTVSASRRVGALDDRSEIENTSSGGSALTEKTEVAVSPTGPLARVCRDDGDARGVIAKRGLELVRSERDGTVPARSIPTVITQD